MISLKSNYIISIIFFILQILRVFGDSDFSLYSVTSNPVGSYVTIVIPFYNQVIANTSLNLDGLNIQSFLTVDQGVNVILLLCQDSKNSNYLVIADVKTGEIKKSKGIQNDGFNIKNNNNYIYSNVTDDIYLPTFSNGELTILHWNFNEQSDYANQLTVNGISDIDPTYQPKGVITSNNGLYIFYKSIDNNNNNNNNNSTSKLVLFNLNNTDSSSLSSSSLQPVLPTIEIYTYNGFEADNVEMIYIDNEDNNIVYAVYNTNGTTRSCTLLFSEQNSICQDAYFDYNLNPNNYNYNPYFITSDLSSFVSLQSTSPTQLVFGVWSLDFGADTTTLIYNLWQSTNPSNITYFKN
ncbi:hypothetical protein DDB_G0268146 [Dictyostelium discoideum AX4]|uniref:Uncharacterized protein n=1 Tax=Dictyostelium discoideum TaxID=44689 RepID=Q55FE9_DICDI|nr:hypothetical protein DDB_G0268146 [Dictyostelium discoideum AX4]EAL73526.1 hypothetical protein DDB_G0268146 [Dictyostelium discoideum AX4]|eukprot:XP_647584.1 hypothetical protein DDB_G0268146 [Dictyostelium discoideum AX4]